MVKLGLTPEGNWTFYYFCNKVRRFNLRTNFMAIIASFTNIRSSCIATLNTFYERKKKKKRKIILLDNHFCWKASQQTISTLKQKNPRSRREKGRKKKKQNPLRKAKQNLKIYLDNILNNLCDSTPRQIFLTAA